MTGRRVLVVNVERQLVRGLRIILRGAGYSVDVAETQAQALAKMAASPPDAVLLDLMLADGAGGELCAQVRGRSDVPIVVISAVGDERRTIAALEAGADDYVTAPFVMDDLLARLRAVLARTVAQRAGPVSLVVGELLIEIPGRRVTRAGAIVELAPVEFEVLRMLAENRGGLVTHRRLLRALWPLECDSAGYALRVEIARIRSKLERDPGRPEYVISEPGLGYRLRDPTNPAGLAAPAAVESGRSWRRAREVVAR